MNPPGNDLLLLAGKIITVFMQIAMAIGATALIIGAGALLFYRDTINAEFIAESGNPDAVFPIFALFGVMLIGLAIVAALFLFFRRLREIINTVSNGDPFEPANSGRLNQMAWLMLSVQLLVLPAIPLALELAKVGEEVGEDLGLSVDGGLDLSGILMVIILFILARVFRHGAAMREDLEGTV
jgi:ABC-type transport system involved in multi-copper enzyme maturation permease subunit